MGSVSFFLAYDEGKFKIICNYLKYYFCFAKYLKFSNYNIL